MYKITYTQHTSTSKTREIWIRLVNYINVNIPVVIFYDSFVKFSIGRNPAKHTRNLCVVFLTTVCKPIIVSVKFLFYFKFFKMWMCQDKWGAKLHLGQRRNSFVCYKTFSYKTVTYKKISVYCRGWGGMNSSFETIHSCYLRKGKKEKEVSQ